MSEKNGMNEKAQDIARRNRMSVGDLQVRDDV
jgi:hypothetical protein